MHEDLARTLYYFGVHLLYASLVWLVAWALTSVRFGSATTKYWIWVATSLNFFLPLGAVVDHVLAEHLSWARPLGMIGAAGAAIAQGGVAALALGGAWLLGTALMAVRLCLRLRADRRDARATAGASASGPRFFAHGVPVRFGGARQAPAVNGLLRPHISLPSGIERLLSAPELSAVLIHELTHARRRDNLIRLIHEVGLCGLWFHPLVWISGSRLALYRELSCDESVIQRAHGRDLISALTKLADPGEALLLQASAASFFGRRLARLAGGTRGTSRAANALLTVVFSAVVVGGVLETIAHTACCFLVKK